jgi:glycerol transport system ATP-binding protein
MALVLENLARSVGGVVQLAPTTLSLPRGSLTVLLGPTLAGKTTLLRLMAGLDRPDSGRVLMDGADVTHLPVRRRRVAMVYQQFINYPTLSVYENIASPLRVAGLSRGEIEDKVRAAARLLRLDAFLSRTPRELSGGQQQRTAIARALVKGADLVLMDEPLANLDYKLREELREELPRVFEASGAVFVYASTEPAEALMFGGNVATLHQGRITQFGPASDVYRHPADLLTAETFSDPPLNVFGAVKADGRVQLATGESIPSADLPPLPDGELTLAARAHELALHAAPHAVALAGRVRVSEISGSESFVHVALGDGQDRVVQAPGVYRHEPGSGISVWLDPKRLFAFGADGRLLAAPGAA